MTGAAWPLLAGVVYLVLVVVSLVSIYVGTRYPR